METGIKKRAKVAPKKNTYAAIRPATIQGEIAGSISNDAGSIPCAPESEGV